MKKLVSLVLALMMVLSLATNAFASEPDPSAITELGSITIQNVALEENVAADQTVTYSPVADYSLFQILILDSYTPGVPATDTTPAIPGKYSYIIAPGWEDFFAEGSDALDYVTVTDNKYVTAKTTFTDDNAPAFAALAMAYAEAQNLVPVKSTANAGDAQYTHAADNKTTTIVFDNLELGYYLIDSTMGTLCGLTTTNPAASVTAKNHPPKIDKQVQEDSLVESGSGQTYSQENTADIGQTVRFSSTITVTAGAEDYVLHDKMSAGLTFDKIESISHVVPGSASDDDDITSRTDYYTVDTNPTDDCTFDVVFTEEFHKVIKDNDKIVVVYTAVLNENALIYTDGNTNEAWLSFGEDSTSTHSITTTYTFAFDIVKTDDENKLIEGAEFRIYTKQKSEDPSGDSGVEIPVVFDAEQNVYRRATDEEIAAAGGADKMDPIVVTGGKVRVVGFDNGTYYLEETKAPTGYNKLTIRHPFTINSSNLDASFNTSDGSLSTGTGVQVKNKTGSMLPETGAMGTTLFISFGTFVVLAAGVLLVTKKRMSMIED